jgi:hypothetical protein
MAVDASILARAPLGKLCEVDVHPCAVFCRYGPDNQAQRFLPRVSATNGPPGGRPRKHMPRAVPSRGVTFVTLACSVRVSRIY